MGGLGVLIQGSGCLVWYCPTVQPQSGRFQSPRRTGELGRSPYMGSRRITATLQAYPLLATTGSAKWVQSALERASPGHACINHISASIEPDAAVAAGLLL